MILSSPPSIRGNSGPFTFSAPTAPRPARRPDRRASFAAAAVLLAGLAVGCGDSQPEQDFYVEPETPDNPVARTEAAAAELADREELPTTSEIRAVNESGVTGRLTTMQRNGELVVVLEVEDLPEAIEYQTHIHRGVCSEGGAVALALNPVVALADGTGSSTTTLGPDEISPSEPLFVQVHGGGGSPIACGDLVEADS